MAKPVSQSRTMWVKKGTVVDGKKVKKGYVAQYGRPEKRVTARIKLEEATRRGKKGDVVAYKSGRYKKTVGKGQVDRSKKTAGGGVTKAQAAAQRRNAVSSGGQAAPSAPPKTKQTKSKGYKTASRIGGYTPGTRLAGAGKDGVNAKTSEGSGRTSDYVHDTFSSYWNQPRRQGSPSGNPYMTGNRPSNRPMRGQRSQLRKDKKGNYRWIKVM